jgi:hypothetical protein
MYEELLQQKNAVMFECLMTEAVIILKKNENVVVKVKFTVFTKTSMNCFH